MIVYQSTKEGFIADVNSRQIDRIIHDVFLEKLGRHVSASERESWGNSMHYMKDVLRDEAIPDDSSVAIEYQIPQTAKRIDFLLTGQDEHGSDNAILIELKQWSKVKLSEKDGIVDTDFFGEVNHPSYQAWSYAALLKGFNEAVYEEDIGLRPCAYLHNYIEDDVIRHPRYSSYLERAPVFLQGDDEKENLRAFIRKYVKTGDRNKVLYRIENGRIRPSKSLADSLVKMLKGNQEFVMIDDQKVVYETVLSLAKGASDNRKIVLIVQGGPGTGKSVVAINLLATLTKTGLMVKYVTKNAAPRSVYESKLTGSFRKTEISNLFSGSGSFHDADSNVFDVLVVDETQRLVEKSGMFRNHGENQIKEIIKAAKLSVFFLDEDQRVTWQDIGERGEIIKHAKSAGAEIYESELASQFRCGGSNDYLLWLDDALQVKPTAVPFLGGVSYDFRIFDSPSDLFGEIISKNTENKARMVAGYCWDWVSKKDKSLYDIDLPEYGFKMKWNLASYGSLWILEKESVNEIGCIHTCQGLDLDYVGVIVGPDLVVRNGKVVTDPYKRAKTDHSLRGFKTAIKNNEPGTIEKVDALIKNTYRTLMTRGMKGCYVFFTDKETADYFRSKMHIPGSGL